MTTTDQLKPNHSLGLLKTIMAYFKPYKLAIFLALIAMCIVGLSDAAVAWLVQPALDKIFIQKDRDALVIIPLLLFLLFLVKGIFVFIQKYSMSYFGTKVLERIQNDLYAKIIRLPSGYFSQTRIGMLMSRVISDVGLISKSLPSIINLSRDGISVIGLVGMLIYRDASLAFWALVVCPVCVYPIVYFGKKLRKIGRRSQSQLAVLTSVLQESLSGIPVIKAFATEHHETQRFKEDNAKYVRILLKGRVYTQLSSPIMDLIGAIGAGMVIWVGGLRVINGILTPGEFFSFMTALFLLYKPIKSLNEGNLDIQNALAGAERVFEILHSDEILEESGGSQKVRQPLQSLEFQNVSFGYAGTDRLALENINLTIKAGEKVALVGPSGAGKTTFAQLVPRFYDPKQGQILINNIPLQEYTLDSLRRSIGIVSQDPFLFNLSVRENIAYGRNDIGQDQVEAAAKAAFAHDFIMELPEGYNTVIGERGITLSGGQKQRLTIARALLKNPPLLILDEATSALDTESERIVQQALDNLMKERTSIVIAHRLSTVLSADRIVVIACGRILAVGSHTELLDKSPLYAKLYAMQFKDEALDISTLE